MPIMDITVVPLGTANTSISPYVAACHRVLSEVKGIKYQLTSMGTAIEGELEVLFEVAKRLHEVPFQEGAQRVATTIRIDDRRDKISTMEGKVEAVHSKLL